MTNIVYAFQYCPCIHESAYATVNIYRTRKSAEIAMEFHRGKKRKEYDEYHQEILKDIPDFPYGFGEYERWTIEEIEILE